MITPVPNHPSLGVEKLPDGRVRVMGQDVLMGAWVCIAVVKPEDLDAVLADPPPITGPMLPAATPAGGASLSPAVRDAIRKLAT